MIFYPCHHHTQIHLHYVNIIMFTYDYGFMREIVVSFKSSKRFVGLPFPSLNTWSMSPCVHLITLNTDIIPHDNKILFYNNLFINLSASFQVISCCTTKYERVDVLWLQSSGGDKEVGVGGESGGGCWRHLETPPNPLLTTTQLNNGLINHHANI